MLRWIVARGDAQAKMEGKEKDDYGLIDSNRRVEEWRLTDVIRE